MSSFYAPYFGTALVLDSDEYLNLRRNYCAYHQIDESDFNSLIDDRTGLLLPEYREDPDTVSEDNRFSLLHLSDDDGSSDGIGFNKFNQNASDGLEDREYLDEAFAVFCGNDRLNPTLPAPYASMAELVNEFKNKIGAYLPDDFDYEAHIGFLSYCCWA